MMDFFSTHLPMLMKYSFKTDNPILEIGAGHYSTPILHEICSINKRKLVTLELNVDFFNTFKYLINDWHEINHVNSWESYNWNSLLTIKWGVIFIDHDPCERRHIDIDYFKNSTEYMILHDSESPTCKYDLIYDKFKYKHFYTNYYPFTAVISNFNNLE